MKDRLQKIIVSEGITPALLADEIGVQRSGISHILSGRNNPSYDFIQKLLIRFPRINAEWLLLGKGSMYQSSASGYVQSDIFAEVPKVSPPPTDPASKINLSPGEDDIKNNTGLRYDPRDSETLIKTIEKIVIFYSDHTFKEYTPSG